MQAEGQGAVQLPMLPHLVNSTGPWGQNGEAHRIQPHSQIPGLVQGPAHSGPHSHVEFALGQVSARPNLAALSQQVHCPQEAPYPPGDGPLLRPTAPAFLCPLLLLFPHRTLNSWWEGAAGLAEPGRDVACQLRSVNRSIRKTVWAYSCHEATMPCMLASEGALSPRQWEAPASPYRHLPKPVVAGHSPLVGIFLGHVPSRHVLPEGPSRCQLAS